MVGKLTNIREVPAKTTKYRKIRIVAGRRFRAWRFLLVNQLPLSIMAVHAQYRATAPLRQKYAFPRLNLQKCLISPTAIKNYKLYRFLPRGQNPSEHPSSPCVNRENIKTRRSKIVSRTVATNSQNGMCCRMS